MTSVDYMVRDLIRYFHQFPETDHRGKYKTVRVYCAENRIRIRKFERQTIESTLYRMNKAAGRLAVPIDDPDLLRVYAWPIATLDDWKASVGAWKRSTGNLSIPHPNASPRGL